MKVFIMWSGDRSKTVAEALYRFLRATVQGPQYFISSEKIEKGAVWREVLASQLGETTFGIACLTKEALSSLWIHFEAGAISRAPVGERHVVPYLVGLREADLVGPLTEFQATLATDEGTRALVKSIDHARPSAERLPDAAREDAFDAQWPRLQKVISSLPPAPTAAGAPVTRGADDVQRETLETVRELLRRSASAPTPPIVEWMPTLTMPEVDKEDPIPGWQILSQRLREPERAIVVLYTRDAAHAAARALTEGRPKVADAVEGAAFAAAIAAAAGTKVGRFPRAISLPRSAVPLVMNIPGVALIDVGAPPS